MCSATGRSTTAVGIEDDESVNGVPGETRPFWPVVARPETNQQDLVIEGRLSAV